MGRDRCTAVAFWAHSVVNYLEQGGYSVFGDTQPDHHGFESAAYAAHHDFHRSVYPWAMPVGEVMRDSLKCGKAAPLQEQTTPWPVLVVGSLV